MRRRPVDWPIVIAIVALAAWLVFGNYDCSGLGMIGGVP